MEDIIESSGDSRADILSRVSWIAYVRLILINMLLWGALIAVAALFRPWLGAVIGVVALAWLTVQILLLRSIRLYVDDQGVWVYSGIFPWNRGISGVKWRDLDTAVYLTGFTSWLLRAYTVHIGHRYTKSSEIILASMHNGHVAVQRINEQHQALVEQSRDA